MGLSAFQPGGAFQTNAFQIDSAGVVLTITDTDILPLPINAVLADHQPTIKGRRNTRDVRAMNVKSTPVMGRGRFNP